MKNPSLGSRVEKKLEEKHEIQIKNFGNNNITMLISYF